MEHIFIWFATGFSFVAGAAFGFFCFRVRPSRTDSLMARLMIERNELDAQKVQALRMISEAMKGQ